MGIELKQYEFSTTGITFYQGYCLELHVTSLDQSIATIKNNNRYILIFVRQGNGVMVTGNDQIQYSGPGFLLLDSEAGSTTIIQHEVNYGFIIYFHPGVVNSRFTMSNINGVQDFTFPSDIQDLHILGSFIRLLPGSGEYIPMKSEDCEYVYTICRRMEAVLIKQLDNLWPCNSRSYFIKLLFFLQSLAEPLHQTKEESVPSGELRDIYLYLHTHYHELLTVGDIARKFGTNKTTLNAQFRYHFQSSIKHYLINLRLNIAMSLLRNTELSVREICYRVGFRDVTHFHRSFRKRSKLSPGEYRKQYIQY